MEQNDDDEKRTAWLPKVRATTAEREAITAKARAAGLSLSEFQRRACLSGVVVVQNERERVQVVRQLAAIGNNLNQIARKVHVQGGLDGTTTARLRDVLATLETMLDEATHGP